MKTSASHDGKGKLHEAKGETSEKSRKLTDDPTLEGKDENKVGRIQRKTRPAQKVDPLTVSTRADHL